MELVARAKVNLFLRVAGRRADGYHELETVYQSVSLADTVTLELTGRPWDAQPVHLTCDTEGIPADDRNLAWRAAMALARRTGDMPLPGVRIALSKQIPAGGGLGGGSSDAAAVLAGLRRLWNLPLEDAALAAVAAEIGSDVPFFLTGGTALGTGRGELLTPLPPLPPLHLVLVTPSFGVATAWAYGARVVAEEAAPTLTDFLTAVRSGTAEAIAAALRNDLEAGVVAQHPEIEAIRRELLAAGALGARMTGSGSTVFAIARDAADAARIAAALARPGRRVVAVRTVTAEEARAGWG